MEQPLQDIAEIAHRMDALGLWDAISPFTWSVCPRGTVLPYFCCVVKGEIPAVKQRFLLLEGWQTFHDFIRSRVDRDYGFYSSPVEFPHYELVVVAEGASVLFRHDTGYLPVEVKDPARVALCAKMLWQAFGLMMRLENDAQLPMKYAGEKAMFARVEGRDGAWSDAPLPIPDPRPHVENIRFEKEAVRAAKDMPFVADEILEVDFALQPGLMTREPRPRFAYALRAVDAESGKELFRDIASVNPETGLRGMWEGVAPRILAHLIKCGHIPGEIRVRSGRLFRMLRLLCVELPFKLSLHQKLSRIA